VGNLRADTIYLKNGRSLEGFIKNEDADRVELDVGFGSVKFRRQEIERIYKSTPEESSQIYEKWEKKKQEAQQRRQLQEYAPKYIQIQPNKGHIVVDALLNKKVYAQLFLDTGASVVVLSSKIGEDLGLDIGNIKDVIILELADGRKIEAKFINLENVSVEEVETENVTAAILPADADISSFKDGLLGMSFLERFNFQVDQENQKLILEKLK
jgi:clan AA aspartic protease (TIGR02281 family)